MSGPFSLQHLPSPWSLLRCPTRTKSNIPLRSELTLSGSPTKSSVPPSSSPDYTVNVLLIGRPSSLRQSSGWLVSLRVCRRYAWLMLIIGCIYLLLYSMCLQRINSIDRASADQATPSNFWYQLPLFGPGTLARCYPPSIGCHRRNVLANVAPSNEGGGVLGADEVQMGYDTKDNGAKGSHEITAKSIQLTLERETGRGLRDDWSAVRAAPAAVHGDTGKVLPNAIIIGARKSGTRALLEFLGLHPAIAVAPLEVHFFDNDTAYDELGLDWYRNQMPPIHSPRVRFAMEKTPGYFVNPRVPLRVYKMDPNVKIILILRDPVIRTVSDYTQVLLTKLARHKPHQPLEMLAFDDYGALNRSYKPVRNSLYYKHLRRWLDVFNRSSLHIVDGERFISSPIGELRKIEKFLSIPPLISESQLYYNATKGFYCFITNEGVRTCLGESKGRTHASVRPWVLDKLKNLFAVYNRKLFDLIGTELWT